MKFNDYLKNLVKPVIKNINETSLSRVWRQVTKHESGTITAYRYAKDCGDGVIYTKKENKKRNNELLAKLLKKGYSVTKVKGTYIENYGSKDEIPVKEESFLVVDINDTGNLRKDLIKLGKEFEQDSVTFSKPNGDYFLVSTNDCEDGYPGHGKIGIDVKLGKSLFGKKGEFFSRVNGRPFVFESCENVLYNLKNDYPTHIRSILSNH
jgi:hypothetical protein